jgi:hypothetical protein
VACAATAAHEMVRAEGVELSIEFLHWAAKRHDGLPVSEEGTTLAAARTALGQDGQPPETMWRYDDSRDQQAAQYQPPPGAIIDAKQRVLTDGAEICPISATLRDALNDGRLVILGLRIHHTWHFVGQDGQIATPIGTVRDLGGHAVVVVGYQDDDFTVQNSWGSGWGEGGYGYLRSDYVDDHGIAAWILSW